MTKHDVSGNTGVTSSPAVTGLRFQLALDWYRPEPNAFSYVTVEGKQTLQTFRWEACQPLKKARLWKEFSLKDATDEEIFLLTQKYGFLRKFQIGVDNLPQNSIDVETIKFTKCISSKVNQVYEPLEADEIRRELNLLWKIDNLNKLSKSGNIHEINRQIGEIIQPKDLVNYSDLIPFWNILYSPGNPLEKEFVDDISIEDIQPTMEDIDRLKVYMDTYSIPEQPGTCIQSGNIRYEFFNIAHSELRDKQFLGIIGVREKHIHRENRDISLMEQGFRRMVWTPDTLNQAINEVLTLKTTGVGLAFGLSDQAPRLVVPDLQTGLWLQLAFTALGCAFAICPVCHQPIQPGRKSQIYCGEACKQAAYRKRNACVTTVAQPATEVTQKSRKRQESKSKKPRPQGHS